MTVDAAKRQDVCGQSGSIDELQRLMLRELGVMIITPESSDGLQSS